VLVAVTDHAAERYRQRVAGSLDPRQEIAGRVRRALQAGRASEQPPPGATGARGSLYVHDADDRALVFVCRRERGGHELVVVTLWERDDAAAPPRVPRRFTDALDRRGAERNDPPEPGPAPASEPADGEGLEPDRDPA
jgi:hypothetical protein